MNIDTRNVIAKKPRYHNLDLIKALCISLVLIWHLEPIDISIPNITAFSANIIFKEAQIALYFQVTLIAVPAFLITSQYLYIQKLEEYGHRYFFKRLGTLIYVAVFWIFCQCLFYYIFATPKPAGTIAEFLPHSGMAWLNLFLNGGPSLPIVGGSVFYYLSILIILTSFSTLFVMGCRFKWFEISIGLIIIMGSLVYFQIHSLDGWDIGSSKIQNFIVYTPIAYFMHKYGRKLNISRLILIWIAYLVFSGEDIILRRSGMPFNVYGRVSIVFGAVMLVGSFINQIHIRDFKPATFLSTHSLGLYALHKYFQYFVTLQLMPLFTVYNIRKKIPVGELRINFQVLIIAILTFIFTSTCVYILGKTWLKRFVK